MARYAWSSQAWGTGRIIPSIMTPVDLSQSPVFQYKDGSLASKLSVDIQVLPGKAVSETILAPTVKI